MMRLQRTLRILAILALLAALVNPSVPGESRARCRFYVVDLSESFTAVEGWPGALSRERVVEMINFDLRRLDSRDFAAVVSFGRSVQFQAMPAPAARIGVIESVKPPDDATGSKLAAALEACRAHLPPGTVGEAVVFTDGAISDSEPELAAAAAATGLEVILVPTGLGFARDARIVSIEHPPRVRPGEPFWVKVGATATVDGPATIAVEDKSESVHLVAGATVFVRIEGVRPSQRAVTLNLQLEGEDVCPENNQVRLDIPVETDQPRVLLLHHGESALPELLAGFQVETSHTVRTPSDYAAVILENVPARRLSEHQMNLLREYVEDFGGGLLIIGGPEAYGGEYLDTPLDALSPLRAVPDDKRAVVFVLDVSGSMGREIEPGRRRIDLLKEAAARAAKVLSPDDWVAIVKIPETGQPVLPLGRYEHGERFSQALDALKVESYTNILAALKDAGLRVLKDVEEGVKKHVVLVTDGETEEKEEDFKALAGSFRSGGVEGTLVLTAEPSKLGVMGWPTTVASDFRKLPEILRAALKARAGLFAVDANATPAPGSWMGAGVEPFTLPSINRTTARLAAEVMISSEAGPVGAFRPVRTGGCAALALGTNQSWVGAQREPVGRVIRNCVERLASNRDAPLYVQTIPGGDGLRIRIAPGRGQVPESLGSVEASFKHLLSGRSAERAARLIRVDAKTFEGTLPDLGPGTYVLDVHALKARGHAVRLYGSELERVGIDAASMARMARLPGWRVTPNFSQFSTGPVTRAAAVDLPLRPWLGALGLALFVAQLLVGAFWKR